MGTNETKRLNIPLGFLRLNGSRLFRRSKSRPATGVRDQGVEGEKVPIRASPGALIVSAGASRFS